MLYALIVCLFYYNLSSVSDEIKTHQIAQELLIELEVLIGNSNWWTIRRQNLWNTKKNKRSYQTKRMPLWMEIGREILTAMMQLYLLVEFSLYTNTIFQIISAISAQGCISMLLITPLFNRIRKLISDVCLSLTKNISGVLGMVTEKIQSYTIPGIGNKYNFEIIITFYMLIIQNKIDGFFTFCIGLLIMEKTWIQLDVEPSTFQEINNPVFREKIQIFVKMPDAKTISIFPNVGTPFLQILSLPQFSMIDKNDFFLKANNPIKLISEEHRITTLYLIPKLRGGSHELDELREEMQKELRKKDEENIKLLEKLEQLQILLGKQKSDNNSDSEDTPHQPMVENITPPEIIKEPTVVVQEITTNSVKSAKCKGLSVYDGSQDWEDWIKKFNLFAMADGWTEKIKVSTFVNYMSEDIKVVLAELTPNDFNNFIMLASMVKQLFDKKRKSPVEFLKQLLNATMYNTKSKNAAQWYTKVINLAALAGIKNIQKDYQVKVVLINGLRPASLFKDVSAIYNVDYKNVMNNFSLNQIYQTVLEKEKLSISTNNIINEDKDTTQPNNPNNNNNNNNNKKNNNNNNHNHKNNKN